MSYNGSFLITEVNALQIANSWPGRLVQATEGFVMGGPSNSAGTLTVRMQYSDDTALMTNRGNMSTSGTNAAGGGGVLNTSSFCWGLNPHPTTIEKFTHATNTCSIPTGKGTQSNSSRSGWDRVDYIHVCGGANNVNNHERYDLTSETSNAITRGLMTFGHWRGGGMSTEVYGAGYVVGGSGAGTTYHTTVDKWSHATDNSTATKVANRPHASGDVSGGATKEHGYAVGGNQSGTSSVDRLLFATDTTDMVTRTTLTKASANKGVHGSEEYKYVSGGYSGGAFSTTERWDISNDTAAVVARGNLPQTMGSPHGGSEGNSHDPG